jgi:hypothetical protein
MLADNPLRGKREPVRAAENPCRARIASSVLCTVARLGHCRQSLEAGEPGAVSYRRGRHATDPATFAMSSTASPSPSNTSIPGTPWSSVHHASSAPFSTSHSNADDGCAHGRVTGLSTPGTRRRRAPARSSATTTPRRHIDAEAPDNLPAEPVASLSQPRFHAGRVVGGWTLIGERLDGFTQARLERRSARWIPALVHHGATFDSCGRGGHRAARAYRCDLARDGKPMGSTAIRSGAPELRDGQ